MESRLVLGASVLHGRDINCISRCFLAAALTVPAGFGLSTILTPLVLILLPVHEAVAVVAVVHCAHNAGKYIALKEAVDFHAFRRYGVWLVVGSIIGALLQNQVPNDPPTFVSWNIPCDITNINN